MVYGTLYVIICLHFDTDLHMFIENAAFIQKKARLNKFYILFVIIGTMIMSVVYFNFDLIIWKRPPMEWYTNSRLKCNE